MHERIPLVLPGSTHRRLACLCPDFFCQLFDGLYKILAKLPDEPTKVLTRGLEFSADSSAGGGGDGIQWQYLAVMMTQWVPIQSCNKGGAKILDAGTIAMLPFSPPLSMQQWMQWERCIPGSRLFVLLIMIVSWSPWWRWQDSPD